MIMIQKIQVKTTQDPIPEKEELLHYYLFFNQRNGLRFLLFPYISK